MQVPVLYTRWNPNTEYNHAGLEKCVVGLIGDLACLLMNELINWNGFFFVKKKLTYSQYSLALLAVVIFHSPHVPLSPTVFRECQISVINPGNIKDIYMKLHECVHNHVLCLPSPLDNSIGVFLIFFQAEPHGVLRNQTQVLRETEVCACPAWAVWDTHIHTNTVCPLLSWSLAGDISRHRSIGESLSRHTHTHTIGLSHILCENLITFH